MALKTSRAYDPAQVTIDRARCSACGLCAQICCGLTLRMEDGEVVVDQSRLFGCIGCGQCAAVCPKDCISMEGRDLAPGDFIDQPPASDRSSYPQLHNLMLSRRSVRHFQDREVDDAAIDSILASASTAPMGVPPTDVGVLVLQTRPGVREFRDDCLKGLDSMKWMCSSLGSALMRPFIGKEGAEMMRSFMRPVIDLYNERDKAGEDWFFYDAPLAMLFYGSPYSDPSDSVIAATHAVLAAESLGLGSCMLGIPAYAVKSSGRIKEKYGLPSRIGSGLCVVFGYPGAIYRKAIVRRFADVRYWPPKDAGSRGSK